MECVFPDITVHYEVFGEGRPLIVLPGWPDTGRVPAQYLEPVFDGRRGWRRFYLDLPGRGGTPGPAWITSNDQILDIVLAVIDRLVPERRFVIAGHSAGAYLARAVVARRGPDVDGLLQVVPVISPDDDDVPDPITILRDDALIARVEAELGPEQAAAITHALVVQRPEIYDHVKPLLPEMQRADRVFLARLEESLSFPVDPLPTPFPGPALFVLGRQDHVVGYRAALRLEADYPRATFAVLDGAGHSLPWERPDAFSALVRDWLDRLEVAGPS
jgi:pimeloyl-ACP methyl ester carboxylesterase